MGYAKCVLMFFVTACVLIGAVEKRCEAFDENGLCLEPCPKDTIMYVADCVNETMSQSTCTQPVPRRIGIYCDYRRCDCIHPKVFDKTAIKCVYLEDCADQSDEIPEE